jgi:hypothetical protein
VQRVVILGLSSRWNWTVFFSIVAKLRAASDSATSRTALDNSQGSPEPMTKSAEDDDAVIGRLTPHRGGIIVLNFVNRNASFKELGHCSTQRSFARACDAQAQPKNNCKFQNF